MKILVIGSLGFIGSHCFNFFRGKGDSVFGCDIYPSNEKNYTRLNADAADYKGIFSSRDFEVCINASGSRGVGFSIENLELDHKLNVTNVALMLDALKGTNPRCKFINLSSAAIYGNHGNLPLKEDFAPAPISPYGKHKLESELLLKERYNKDGLRTCSLRIFSVYGPGLKKQIFWDMYQKTKLPDSHEVRLFGTGEEIRDFIFVSDLMNAIEATMQNAVFSGEAINVASGSEITVRNAASLFLKCLDNSCNLHFIGTHKSGDPECLKADITRLKNLGFKSQTSFETGIKLYVQWLKENN